MTLSPLCFNFPQPDQSLSLLSRLYPRTLYGFFLIPRKPPSLGLSPFSYICPFSFVLSFLDGGVVLAFGYKWVSESTWIPSLVTRLFMFGSSAIDGLLICLRFGTEIMGLDKGSDTEKEPHPNEEEQKSGKTSRKGSGACIGAHTEEDEDDEDRKLELGPQCTLKEQLEKDKDDESLRKWKEQLLGTVDINAVGESLDPEVKIMSLAIKSPGRDDIILAIPQEGNPRGAWFTLKEGSKYSLEFTFHVKNNIVSGLRYSNTVWKTGVKVDTTKEMIGTFSPQAEPYTHIMPEETTPSGIFARGSYSAKTRFVDDDGKCYLGINYTFDIRKEWL